MTEQFKTVCEFTTTPTLFNNGQYLGKIIQVALIWKKVKKYGPYYDLLAKYTANWNYYSPGSPHMSRRLGKNIGETIVSDFT